MAGSADLQDAEETVAQDQVYSSVSATHIASPAVSIDHYYGPSSNFSFLEQIHRRFNALLPTTATANTIGAVSKEPEATADGTADGVQRFEYGRLFFGGKRTDLDRAKPCPYAAYEPTASIESFLAQGKARHAMEQFLLTSHNTIPIWPPPEFLRALDTFGSILCVRKGIVLAALALGCTITKDIENGEGLFEQARLISKTFDDVVNLEMVQLNIFLISALLPSWA